MASELLVDGSVVDPETMDVGESSASSEHELSAQNDPDEVRLTVTDDSGDETSETTDY